LGQIYSKQLSIEVRPLKGGGTATGEGE